MCEFISFFIHDNAARLPLKKRYLFGNLRSHFETMELHGVEYGGEGDRWREVEWTGSEPRDLTVSCFSAEQEPALKAVLLADFPTRYDLIKYAVQHLPPTVECLDLRDCTEITELPKIPTQITWLNLSGCSGLRYLPRRLAVKRLYLNGCTGITELSEMPEVRTLDLEGCTGIKKLPRLPAVNWLDLTGCTGIKTLPELPATAKVIR